MTLGKKGLESLSNNLVLDKSNPIGFLPTILRKDFDVIHTHGLRVPFSSLSGIMRKINGDKVVMTVHTIFPERSAIDALQKKIYDLTLGGISLRAFDKFIAITGSLANSLADRGVSKGKIAVIPNSVDIERFTALPSPHLFLEEVGVPPSKDVVLMVGRIDWQKGLINAVKAFAEIQKKQSDAILVIIGKDYGYRSQLQDLSKKLGIGSKVIFAGQVGEEVLLSAYSCAKVLLMTSIHEGFPTVLLEAMACGLPIVSTYISGVTEMIDNHRGVIWCQGIKEISSNLLNVISDEELRRYLSIKAKDTVQRDFCWAKNVDKIIETYR